MTSHRFHESENVYRIVDGIYRLHRDLFEIENILIQTSKIQLRLARITINGRIGTMVAGLLAIVPILIALGKIEIGSWPAISVYCLAGAVVLLWICQVRSAGSADRELVTLQGFTSTEPLGDRVDFVLEEMNAWVVRHRLVDRILSELRAAELRPIDATAKRELETRRKRFEEILRSCEDTAQSLLDTSQTLVAAKKRKADDHAELLDWAAGIPRFATQHGQLCGNAQPGAAVDAQQTARP